MIINFFHMCVFIRDVHLSADPRRKPNSLQVNSIHVRISFLRGRNVSLTDVIEGDGISIDDTP